MKIIKNLHYDQVVTILKNAQSNAIVYTFYS